MNEISKRRLNEAEQDFKDAWGAIGVRWIHIPPESTPIRHLLKEDNELKKQPIPDITPALTESQPHPHHAPFVLSQKENFHNQQGKGSISPSLPCWHTPPGKGLYIPYHHLEKHQITVCPAQGAGRSSIKKGVLADKLGVP